MNLSPHFTLKELTISQTAIRKNISNIPNAKEITALQNLCVNILEPLRTKLGKSISVSSGYRSTLVNAAVGGATKSQHLKGEAADIHVEGLSTQQLFEKIIELDLPFDQLIQEFDSWVHISYKAKNNRKEALYAKKNANGKAVFTKA